MPIPFSPSRPPGPRAAPARRRWLALAAVALAWMHGPAAAADSPPDLPVVEVVEVRAREVGVGVEFEGALEAARTSTVAAQVHGNVVERRVQAGDTVQAGQVLAKIDERDAQAGVARSEAAIAQARAELVDAQVAWERSRDLVERGFLSRAALDAAQARLLKARAAERQAIASGRQAALAQNFATVVAPYDGLVLATHLEAGDLAAPGRAVATVYAPQSIRAVAHLPASQRQAVERALRVDIVLAPGRTIVADSVTVLPGVDASSQTSEVRLEFPVSEPFAGVPGQRVRVRFVQASALRRIIPAQALLRRGELDAVYVARADGFSLRAVRVGAAHGEDGVEVLAGLVDGERIAVDPVRAGLTGARPAAARRDR